MVKKWFCGILSVIMVIGNLSFPAVTAKADQAVVSQIPNTDRTIESYNDDFLSVVGFGENEIHSRKEYLGTEQYRQVSDEREFLQAVKDASDGKVKVIEITKDLNLGYFETNLSDAEKKTYTFYSKYEDPTNGYTNPVMEKSGVSKLNIANVDGLTIFSKNGCRIRHTELKLQKSANDLVIRNLSFDEMWQWDDTGKHKEVGWTFIKVNGAANVWIDHCSFTDAADGLIDVENGSSGLTISWCQIGAPASENPASDSAIVHSIDYMEQQYQNGQLGEDSRYYKLRKAGAEKKEIMAYAAYHSKCHLVGSGDKDFCNYVDKNGNVLKDGNAELHITLAYNYYRNMGQRQPMIRQGVGHLINCYFDNSGHAALQKKSVFAQYGGYALSRAINARNGASIAADTCVFQDVAEPLVGAELQGDDTANMGAQWAKLFANAVNHSLIVNSCVSNDAGTYTGSSWDNNGDNLFTKGFTWHDKKSIGNWAWSSSISGVENMDKSNPPTEPFSFQYQTEQKLPYSYKVMSLEDVKKVVPEKSGAGALQLSDEKWCSVKGTENGGDQTDTGEEQVSYPLQKFRLGIGNTNRNVNITGFGDHSALNSWMTNGEENEKWYLNYLRDGVYEIVNARTNKLITAEGETATISEKNNTASQQWKIEGVQKDFTGAYLYYKIRSLADETKVLTFHPDGNRITLEEDTDQLYQKMKINCDGLEGFAANCTVDEGEKAGTIGGLLGETVFVNTMEDMKSALVEERPLTIVVSGDIDCRNENYDWRIEDNKTIVGAYGKNRLHDCKLRTNDYFKEKSPSDNIILKNLNIQIDTNKKMMALAIYSSKNIWVDHCTFHCDFQKEYDEVGKFIWINTPYDGENLKRSPDFITLSYNQFQNRFWGIAFGTQNGVITEDRASIMYNVFDSIVQRAPQMGNGTMHVWNNYYVRNSTSIHDDGMAQIKCGENCVAYSEGNRFENFKKESSGYWDLEVALGGTFIDYDSYSNKTEQGGGTPVPLKFDEKDYTKTTWKPQEHYGFEVMSAYDPNGENDVKAFCSKYAGAASEDGKLHYATDRDMSSYVKKNISAPFLVQPEITAQPEITTEQETQEETTISEQTTEELTTTETVTEPETTTEEETTIEETTTEAATEPEVTTEEETITEVVTEPETTTEEKTTTEIVTEPETTTEEETTIQESTELETSTEEIPTEPEATTEEETTTEVATEPEATTGEETTTEAATEPEVTTEEMTTEPEATTEEVPTGETTTAEVPTKEVPTEESITGPEATTEENTTESETTTEETTTEEVSTEEITTEVPTEPETTTEKVPAEETTTEKVPTQESTEERTTEPEVTTKEKPTKPETTTEEGTTEPEATTKEVPTEAETTIKEVPTQKQTEDKKNETETGTSFITSKKSITLNRNKKAVIAYRITSVNVASQSVDVISQPNGIVRIVKMQAGKIQIKAQKPGVACIVLKTTNGSNQVQRVMIKVRPDKVKKVKVTKKSKNRMEIKWKKQKSVSGYAIYQYQNKKKGWKKIAMTSKQFYVIKNAKKNKKYRFKVRAYKKNKFGTIYGK